MPKTKFEREKPYVVKQYGGGLQLKLLAIAVARAIDNTAEIPLDNHVRLPDTREKPQENLP